MRFVEAFEIRPNSDRVMVEADSIENRMAPGGKIIIPDAAGERTRIGTVIAVGPDAEKTFKIGDRVLFNVYSGINVYAPKYDELNETLKIFRAEELLARVIAK